jgi:hypothetical protein
MSNTSLKKKSASETKVQPASSNNKSDQLSRKSSEEKPLQKKPYIQTKLSVSTPGDSHEQEADRVADEVVSRSAANNASTSNSLLPGSSQPEKTLGNAQSLHTKISRVSDESIAKMDGTDESLPDSLARETESSATESENGVSVEVEQQIESLKGNGTQLPEDVRTEMESQFSHDFSSVCIHNDAAADALCKQLSARAFTVGSDIFFASGEYAPNTQEGKRLLAHELTHVVQQGRGVTRQVMREVAETAAGSGIFVGHNSEGDRYEFNSNVSPGPQKLKISSVNVPRFKMARHAELYAASNESPLYVRRQERHTVQVRNWNRYFRNNAIPLAGIQNNTINENPTEFHVLQSTRVTGFYLFGNKRDLMKRFILPFWDDRHSASIPPAAGAGPAVPPTTTVTESEDDVDDSGATFQVDHRLEDQLGAAADGTQKPLIETPEQNYELLERGANGESGGLVDRYINERIRTAIGLFSGNGISTDVREIRSQYSVAFTSAVSDSRAVPNENVFWSFADISAGQHLNGFRELSAADLAVIAPGTYAPKLFLSESGGLPVDAPNQAGIDIFPRVTSIEALQISGDSASLRVNAYRSGSSNETAPHADYPNITLFFQKLPVGIPGLGNNLFRIKRLETIRAASDPSSVTSAFNSISIPGLSPIRFTSVDLHPDRGFIARGKLLPSVPLFSRADIDVVVEGADVRIQKTFSAGELNVPSPFRIDGASVTLFASSQNGLGIQGDLSVSIDKIGKCDVSAELSTGNGLRLAGRFNFDEGLFNGIDASVNASFHRPNIFDENDHGHWSVGGQIIVPRGKISGIESATVNMSYSDEEGFSAHGEATLSVPGVENGTIDITHNEEEGMVIAGQFNLRQGRGIRGGQISARVQEKPDGSGYAVTAHGEAQPDIPGVNSNLIVDYNDGAFTAEVTADYSRGMLSGQIHAGVTNRTVNEDGTLAETPSENNELVVFGDGQLTIRIAPWLQGTAGVRFAPNGEITVIGEIGLPDQLEIFARREINRSIFSIAVQAPIFPGIVAEVGGGLSATAGIGPGVIDQLVLRVEYNPAHEEDTHITGDAHLRIPANAGLRLNVRAGIGLGITGASATGGLDIGGTLGIEGAAEAGVHVDWTPATGLDISAELAVHAQPSFTFDIGGYVSVRALGFEVYDNRWQFASYTFGSDYRFGIRLPIHYHEGEPFDISTDDIEFEVPDIDTNQLLRGLIARIS